MKEEKIKKTLVIGNVKWVKEEKDKILCPAIPLGWKWSKDYLAILIYDLIKLGYSISEIEKEPVWGEFLKMNGVERIINYCEKVINLEEVRKYIESEIDKIEKGRVLQ